MSPSHSFFKKSAWETEDQFFFWPYETKRKLGYLVGGQIHLCGIRSLLLCRSLAPGGRRLVAVQLATHVHVTLMATKVIWLGKTSEG